MVDMLPVRANACSEQMVNEGSREAPRDGVLTLLRASIWLDMLPNAALPDNLLACDTLGSF